MRHSVFLLPQPKPVQPQAKRAGSTYATERVPWKFKP